MSAQTQHSTAAVPFPSTEWFVALAQIMNSDEEHWRRLGYVDCAGTFSIIDAPGGDRHYRMEFDGYRCAAVREVADALVGDPAFVLEGDMDTWRHMLEHIASNGRARLDQTLNALSIAGAPLRVWSADPLGRDMFFRYNQTFQDLFDRSATITTEYVS
jgi:hypothetical protein